MRKIVKHVSLIAGGLFVIILAIASFVVYALLRYEGTY